MSKQVALMVGTAKGAFVLRGDEKRERWEVEGPHFTGMAVEYVWADTRNGGAAYASVTDPWFGPQLYRSKDAGKTWDKIAAPRFPNEPKREGPAPEAKGGKSVERIWVVEPGGADQPGTLYAGVDPGSLFVSRDSGDSWEEVSGLNDHPSRAQWNPGAGGMCLHTVLVDPRDSKRMFVAISAAGVFYTADGGQTWEPRNKGIRAEFMPDKFPEIGQCVHKLVMHPDRPDVLFLQNHGGVYRSENAGVSWEPIEEGLPAVFGFPLLLHPSEPETVYVIPLTADMARIPPDAHLAVYRSKDSGNTWQALGKGLPERSYMNVLRQAMATDAQDPAGIYFGTRTGQLFGSRDNGDTWTMIEDFLPQIYSVRTLVT
jgi:photosystem II stability/assembly factor-like uncharacterized protein